MVLMQHAGRGGGGEHRERALGPPQNNALACPLVFFGRDAERTPHTRPAARGSCWMTLVGDAACCREMPGKGERGRTPPPTSSSLPLPSPFPPPPFLQESTIGAAFLTKAMPDQGIKFEIW